MAGSEPLIQEADPHITKLAIGARRSDNWSKKILFLSNLIWSKKTCGFLAILCLFVPRATLAIFACKKTNYFFMFFAKCQPQSMQKGRYDNSRKSGREGQLFSLKI